VQYVVPRDPALRVGGAAGLAHARLLCGGCGWDPLHFAPLLHFLIQTG
jgi:hypothetical protein